MKAFEFDTGLLPPDRRLPAFRHGARDFTLDTLGNPNDFACRWRLLKLGDVNAIHSIMTPVRYRRDRAMIEADGEDRIAIHYILNGGETGTLAERAIGVRPGGAAVWDLSRTIDMRNTVPTELMIVTLPRHMLDELFAVTSYDCLLPPSAELALAARHLRAMLDRPEDVPESAAPYFGRAVRDLFAMAMVPAVRRPAAADAASGPLLLRICQTIDDALDSDPDEAAMAALLDVPVERLAQTAARFGGLPDLIERRRLLAAYRLLCDPGETASVSAIAWRCGFTDASRFSRRFRDVFEVSPSQLRRLRTANLPDWAGAYHVETNYGPFLAQ